MRIVFKICPATEWADAERSGTFRGSPLDMRDGYIHLSTAVQVADTAARHFARIDGLMLVAVDAEALGHALKWEAARDGALFPHLYGPLSLGAVLWARPLRLDADGRHVFTDLTAR
jgi:uncharacterized protein (DUF952 family)